MSRTDKIIRETALILVISIAAVVILKAIFLSPYIVKGSSMSDSLLEGDILFALKSNCAKVALQSSKTKYQEYLKNRIVILKSGDCTIIKRCIGIPYDTLMIENQQGEIVTYIVPDDSVFVIGDNFRVSNDSRDFGYVSISDVSGVSIFVFENKFNGIKRK